MTRLPMFSSRRLIRILQSIGFQLEHQRGSHVFLRHPDGRATVVPMHRGEDVGRGLLRKILRDIQMGPKEFSKLT
ncbi:MAG: type II toxin-antitoxin system HicA family toxin [Deltaproteobacteria bacterium]|nr:type II toxin-antitoxin system HicA family toxin [Deltaproteobacteria bacterium]